MTTFTRPNFKISLKRNIVLKCTIARLAPGGEAPETFWGFSLREERFYNRRPGREPPDNAQIIVPNTLQFAQEVGKFSIGCWFRALAYPVPCAWSVLADVYIAGNRVIRWISRRKRKDGNNVAILILRLSE